MILLIDNYDSFTYNLVQYFGELGQDVAVYRNDEITVEQAVGLQPERVVISPGPCTPNEAGVSMDLIESFAGKVPLLGVCLGHQAIGQVFGGKVVRAPRVMHGKTSKVFHDEKWIYRSLPNPFEATRYHSLIVPEASLPDELIACAWVRDTGEPAELMAVRHREYPVYGVQFHPESFLCDAGVQLLKNFLTIGTPHPAGV